MGNKSLYSKQDLLYYYLERKQIHNIKQLFDQHPQIVDTPIIKQNKHTALMRAAYNGNLQIINMLLFYKANVNITTPKGETALTIAVKRGHFEASEILVKAGADIMNLSQAGLRVIQYAILGGFYEIAQLLFNRMDLQQKKLIQDPFTYKDIAKKYSYRYVNYQKFLQGLIAGTLHQEMPNFLVKQKIKLNDPVIDPRQTWKQWFKRQLQWKDAPLVERSQLAQNLQPQNRILGKLHHFTNKHMSTHLSQKTQLYPKQQKQQISQVGQLQNNKMQQLQMQSQV